MKQKKLFTFLVILLFIMSLICCNNDNVHRKQVSPVGFETLNWTNDSSGFSTYAYAYHHYAGKIHYIIYRSGDGGSIFVVNYTDDSTQQSINERFGTSTDVEFDTTCFDPIIDHSHISTSKYFFTGK